MEQFDALKYFEEIAGKNKLVKKHEFYIGYCSGPGGLREIMNEYREVANFILIDDTTSGNTFSNKVGWFERNVYCVNIIAGYEHGNAHDYNSKLRLCRKIFRQLLSRLIYDKERYEFGSAIMYLNTQAIYSNEFGRYSFNGATGLFFQIQNDEPTCLCYKPEDWEV